MQDASSANSPMDLSPMGKIEAAKLVDRYLASFAYLSLPDPDGYQTRMLEVMQRYPKWSGEHAIERANPDNANLPVSAIVLRKWLEEIVAPHRIAAGWKSQAEQQIEDRKLIRGAVEAVRNGQTYEEFKADMAARGLSIDGKRRVRIEDDIADVKQRFNISDADWNALPQGPSEGHWEQLAAQHRK